jgi:hypothetical protein
MTDLEFFFKYEKDISGKTTFSNLNLLRRDIYTCFNINPNDLKSTIGSSALWPGTMAILAGIDLLAKFYLGNDDYNNSKQAFKNYTYEFIGQEYVEELYQLRNALLHSFGLYSTYRKKVYKFVLTEDPSFFIKNNLTNDRCIVSIKTLHHKFEESIINFHNRYKDLDSYDKFDELFKKYGISEIGNSLY